MAGGQNSENIAVEDTSGSVSTPLATPLVPLVAPLATSLQGALSAVKTFSEGSYTVSTFTSA